MALLGLWHGDGTVDYVLEGNSNYIGAVTN